MNNINFNNQINSSGNYKYNSQINHSYTNFGTSIFKLKNLQQDGFQYSNNNVNTVQPKEQGIWAGIKNFFSSPEMKNVLTGLAIIATAILTYLSSKNEDVKNLDNKSDVNTTNETKEKPIEKNETKPETSTIEAATKEKIEVKEIEQPQTTKAEEKQQEQPVDESLADIQKEISQIVQSVNETKIEAIKGPETKIETVEEVKSEPVKEIKAEQTVEKPVQEKKEEDTPKITELPNSKVKQDGKYFDVTVNNGKNWSTLSCYKDTITNHNAPENYDSKKVEGFEMMETTGLYIKNVASSGGGMGTAAIKQAIQISKDIGQDGKLMLSAAIIDPQKGTPVPFYAKLGFKAFSPEVQKEIEKGMQDYKETGVYTGPESTMMYLPKDKAEKLLAK